MKLSEVDNLLLNMTAGLLPEDLSQDECQLLKEKYGEHWFTELGYSVVTHKLPKF